VAGTLELLAVESTGTNTIPHCLRDAPCVHWRCSVPRPRPGPRSFLLSRMVVTHPVESVRAVGPSDVPPTVKRAAVTAALLRVSLPWIGAVGIFIATLLLRVVEPGFDENQFRMMTEGRQVLLTGELPYRDFADPGIFLQILTSAGLQWLFGYNLLGQALFGTAILSTAMVLTFLLARRASGSTPIAFIVTLLALALDTRLKQHHVVFLPVLGLVVCWRYADRPTPRRLVVAALVTAVAFLLRHDQGLYVGAAAAATLAATHWRDGGRVLLRRFGLYGAVATAALLPFFTFLQANGGIVEYFGSAGDYVRSEAESQRVLPWPAFSVDLSAPLVALQDPPPPPAAEINVRWAEGVTTELRVGLESRYQLTKPRQHDDPRGRTWTYLLLDAAEANIAALARDPRIEDTAGIDLKRYVPTTTPEEPFYVTWWRAVPLLGLRVLPGVIRPANAVPWLYYLIVAVPILAILTLLRKRLRGEGPASEVPTIFGAAVMCLLMDGSLREPLGDRLADAAAAPAILGAWLLGQLLTSRVSLPARTRRRSLTGRSHRVLPAIVAVAPRLVSVGVAVSLVGLTMLSVVSLPNVQRRVERAAMLIQHESVAERSRQLFDDLKSSPPIEAPRG
jgi:hypothetical protein